MRSPIAFLTLFVLAAAHPASAQRVPPGTRVRLTTPAKVTGWQFGRVASMTRDSVHVLYAGGDSTTISLADVGMMDASAGSRTPLWAAASSMITVPVGVAIGVMGGLIFALSNTDEVKTYIQRGFWVGAGGGLVTGVGIAVTQKHEDWTPILLPERSDRVVAAAQEPVVPAPSYRPRMRLKLRVRGQRMVGTLVEMRGDSIVVASNTAQSTYPVAAVTDVRVSRGKSAAAGAKFGALIGAGAGVAFGVRQALAPNERNDVRDAGCDTSGTRCRYESDASTVTQAVVGYALLGAIAGAVIRREQWVTGALPSPSRNSEPAKLLLTPSRGGMRIGISAQF